MTKTLTEQWKDGELPEGEYFAITTWSDEIRPLSFYGDCFLDTEVPLDNSVIVEVLAPVPSYDEFVQQRDFVKDHQKVLIENMNLKRKLEIATKALKEINKNYRFTVAQDVVYKALKEMEGVK